MPVIAHCRVCLEAAAGLLVLPVVWELTQVTNPDEQVAVQSVARLCYVLATEQKADLVRVMR